MKTPLEVAREFARRNPGAIPDGRYRVLDPAAVGATSRLWLQWSDPEFVRERLRGIAPGCYCLAKPTVAVMREAADGVEAGRLRVTIDGGHLRIYRHVVPGISGDHETCAAERGRIAEPSGSNGEGEEPERFDEMCGGD